MAKMYKIESLDEAGQWDEELVGNDSAANRFETQEAAWEMVEGLRGWGDDWATAQYRVVEVPCPCDTGEDRLEHLGCLAQECAGLRYDSPEAGAIMSPHEWEGFWPVVGRDGLLTGDICGAEEGFLNVDDMAMIHVQDTRGLRPRNGYIDLSQS